MHAFKGLFLYGTVHRNANMTEMKRSGIEVGFVFADNAKEAENANMTEMRRENHCIRRIRH